MTRQRADEATLNLIFREARTHNGWLERPVARELLLQAWDLAKMGATSANSMPMRVVFVATPEGKRRLAPALAPGNLAKTMAAPVTAIFAHDLEFYERLPKLFPQGDAREWFVGNEGLIGTTAFRNGSLQAAYFMLAARAVGLDCGPMSGFDNALVEAEFFPGGSVKSNFLCNLGYGDPAALYPRGPRLDFDEACQIV